MVSLHFKHVLMSLIEIEWRGVAVLEPDPEMAELFAAR